MILLIGADSGLTMAINRFAETMFPNPILISFIIRGTKLTPIFYRSSSYYAQTPSSVILIGKPGYSIFCICSRTFSISVFKSIAALEISISFAFDKIVLDSLFISCAIKSIFLPMPPVSSRHLRACEI